MTIEEAIEHLDRYNRTGGYITKVGFKDAVKLGIEALKTYQDVRRFLAQLPSELLPGETKE